MTAILPQLRVDGRFVRDVSAAALDALREANNPPSVFMRGSAWVRLRKQGASIGLEPLSQAALSGILERCADCVKGEAGTPARLPEHVVRDLLSLPEPGLPNVSGVSGVPVFLPTGDLVAADGYHEGSGVYLHLVGLGSVQAGMAVGEALRWLDDLLGDFPFRDDASRAHALAVLLLPFVRQLISGPTPLHLADAPGRGTGKGLLVDASSVVATGGPAAVMALTHDNDELEKRLTTVLLEGHPIVLLDNVHTLRADALAAVITANVWRGRRLGRSETVTVPNSAVWLATGNNVALSDEMARRTVLIRLDAGVERPEERTGFRHPDLLAWAREHRTELVGACLSLVQRWVDAGMPEGKGTLGRFESWVNVIGGILEVAGVEGFLANRDEVYQAGDREGTDWRSFCGVWWERFDDHPVTAGEVFALAKERRLLLDLWAGRSDLGAQQRFGHALAGRRDRIFGDYRIRSAGQGETGNAAYRLETLTAQKTPETPEIPTLSMNGYGVLGVSGVLQRPQTDIVEVPLDWLKEEAYDR